MKCSLLLLAACAAPVATPPQAPWISDTNSYGQNLSQSQAISDRYRAAAEKIIATGHPDRGAFNHLAELTTTVGHRMVGSADLDRAIAWAVATMKADGLSNVHTEKVMVPHWVRGEEEGAIVTPNPRTVRVLGLGGTVGTAKGGITAPLVVVTDWKDLDSKNLKGAIVLFDVAMPPYGTNPDDPTGYGRTVGYRMRGAVEAGKRGAVGMLMRSVTARSLGTLHAGALAYDDTQPKIPAAAVTVEDAQLLSRLVARGPVTFHLRLEDQQQPDVEQANVVGELPGKDKPDEIVAIGGHIDSWDVGQGAHDDGAGLVTMMYAAKLLKQLGLQPKRTIRVVGWVGEEYKVRGAKAYAEAHKDELAKHVLAVESDTGGFTPLGFSVSAKDEAGTRRAVQRVAEIASLLQPIHASRVVEGGHETDIAPLGAAGVPQAGLDVDVSTYFDYHHTDADTLDKVDPQQLADDAVAMAVLAYVVADLPFRLDEP
ncbi:MAG: M20/M25/M40 family metallo-hydrolase [Kofleriaceae bacterium]